jgi:hypothetical protein
MDMQSRNHAVLPHFCRGPRRLNRFLWAESNAQICAKERPIHHVFGLAYPAGFKAIAGGESSD